MSSCADTLGSFAFACGQFATREDRAGAGSITIAVAFFGSYSVPDRSEHVFRPLLDVGVERQRQRLAGRHPVGFADRHGLAERVADHPPLT